MTKNKIVKQPFTEPLIVDYILFNYDLTDHNPATINKQFIKAQKEAVDENKAESSWIKSKVESIFSNNTKYAEYAKMQAELAECIRMIYLKYSERAQWFKSYKNADLEMQAEQEYLFTKMMKEDDQSDKQINTMVFYHKNKAIYTLNRHMFTHIKKWFQMVSLSLSYNELPSLSLPYWISPSFHITDAMWRMQTILIKFKNNNALAHKLIGELFAIIKEFKTNEEILQYLRTPERYPDLPVENEQEEITKYIDNHIGTPIKRYAKGKKDPLPDYINDILISRK